MRRREKRPKIKVASYKGKRFGVLLKALVTLFLVGVVIFGALLGQVVGGAHDEINGQPRVMIVLGCQVKPWGPSVLLQDRLDKALDYLNEHPDMTVVVSGGQGPDEPTTEAQAMADYLTANGVSADNLILEPDSHNTSQNLQYSMERLQAAGEDLSGGVLIVSNGFHLTRTKMLAGRAGFEKISLLSAPTSHAPSRLKMYIREPLALVKSFVFDR